jgi:acyl-CoA dehydrogenase
MTRAQLAIAAPPPFLRNDFEQLLERVHTLGRDVIAPAAVEVDRDARFPAEAIEALRGERLFSAYVPRELGGFGLEFADIARIAEALGRYCGATALAFATHQAQVACLVHHGLSTNFFRDYLRELAARQYLLTGATAGDAGSSSAGAGDAFVLENDFQLVPYGEMADGVLVADRQFVLVRKADCVLARTSSWDTLGLRGACSPAFRLKAIVRDAQVLPQPYAHVDTRSLHPASFILLASAWLGLACDALDRARLAVKAEARATPGRLPLSATRLAEAELVLGQMKCAVAATLEAYRKVLLESEDAPPPAFSVGVNNLKLTTSQQVVDVVLRALQVCGLSGFRNDSKLTLGRHLRDATGAALLVNNDRVLAANATMHVGLREA